jgi:glycogen debranching enzyme
MRWTTPDRTPHRQMWIWDSAFHALGWKYLDATMARQAIFAVLERTHENGFIPISMDPISDRLNGESQPPILAWALDRVLAVERMEPKARAWAYGKLSAFLEWMGRERTGAGRGLLGWLKAEDSVTCRCGESGWDNSTRFDHPGPDDHIDLVSFAANEYAVLSRMAASLGKKSESERWEKRRQALAARVNELMWCEEDGLYYDLDQAGKFIRVQSAACFYPLAAGIPTPERAARLRAALLDPKRFATKVPVPSISPAEKAFEKDMWRGPMWVNSNYLIADGLRCYGFEADAKRLVGKTLAEISRWYQRTGVLCEYYDVDGKEDPRFQLRKASRTEGLRVIRDYGWTASLAMAMAREF